MDWGSKPNSAMEPSPVLFKDNLSSVSVPVLRSTKVYIPVVVWLARLPSATVSANRWPSMSMAMWTLGLWRRLAPL